MVNCVSKLDFNQEILLDVAKAMLEAKLKETPRLFSRKVDAELMIHGKQSDLLLNSVIVAAKNDKKPPNTSSSSIRTQVFSFLSGTQVFAERVWRCFCKSSDVTGFPEDRRSSSTAIITTQNEI